MQTSRLKMIKRLYSAVKSDGGALAHADKSLKADKEVVLAALKSEGVLEYADKSFKNDKELYSLQ